MKYSITTFLTVFLMINSCAMAQLKTKSSIVFQNFLDKKSEKSSGVLMAVYAPDININWSGAAGFNSKKKIEKLKSSQPFRIASITKTFTAISILRLIENGKLDINHSIKNYISKEHIKILEQDNYDLNSITIKHCLQHTSGIFDYAVGNNDYVMTALENPLKRWTRTEQIQFAIDHGEPVGKPGEIYHYSDTGYILLGEIIEKLTDKSLADANKELINFKKIGITNTWLESLEDAPKENLKIVSSYLEHINTTKWDNSVDLYGGGGYVGTTSDLVKLYHHLFNNNIFKNKNTLKIMLSSNGIENQGKTASNYKMGIWEVKTPNGNGYMHNGFWGSAVIHFPDYNATIGLYHIDDFDNSLMKETFLEIVKYSKNK